MKLEKAYCVYLACKKENNISQASIDNVNDCVGRFVRLYSVAELKDVDRTAVHGHFVILREHRALALGTLAKHKAAIRAFFNFCINRGWIENNPSDVLLRKEHAYSFKPVHSRPAPKDSTETVVVILHEYARHRRHRFADVRDALLVSMTMDSGNRRGELRKVRRKDLARSLKNGRVLTSGAMAYRLSAMGKTAEAMIQFYDETADLARLTLSCLPDKAIYVFVNSRTGKLLHEDSLRDSFNRICKYAGVERFGFQATRKRTVRDAIVMTGDMKSGQLIAGHSDIRTTMLHYNDIEEEEIEEIGSLVALKRRGSSSNLANEFFNNN